MARNLRWLLRQRTQGVSEMKRLRIIIPVIHYYPDCSSGSDRLAFDHANCLADMGHEVWMVAQALSPQQPECTTEHNVRILRYPAARTHSLSPRLVSLHQRRTREILQRNVVGSVDVVHGHALLSYDGAAGLYLGQAKTCFSLHSPIRPEIVAGARGRSFFRRARSYVAGELCHRIERKCLQVTRVITVDSRYTQLLLVQLHGKELGQRIHVIPGWVDLTRFRIASDRGHAKQVLGWPTDRPVLFTLRRLVPRMGLENLIAALRHVKSNGFSPLLVVGGTGPLLAELKRLVRNLDLEGCVRFSGYVPEDLLPTMYASADAFVLPTTALECFGLIALEALASGRPVLATPVGAIPEIVADVEPQWLAADESTEAIARLLLAFLRNNLPHHDPARLRAAVAGKYSKDEVLRTLVQTSIGDLV